MIEHAVESLVNQRIFALALGYEDLNDHDEFRHDSLLALLSDKADPSGSGRIRQQDKGKALAGKSTLNRLELTPTHANATIRYKKIVVLPEKMDDLLVDLFIESHPTTLRKLPSMLMPPMTGCTEDRKVVSSMAIMITTVIYPLYIFCEAFLLCARLRTADQEGAAGTLEEIQRIVAQLRRHWPETRIILRGDSGFCRDNLVQWCEGQPRVNFLFGLAKNTRLKAETEAEMVQAKKQH